MSIINFIKKLFNNLKQFKLKNNFTFKDILFIFIYFIYTIFTISILLWWIYTNIVYWIEIDNNNNNFNNTTTINSNITWTLLTTTKYLNTINLNNFKDDLNIIWCLSKNYLITEPKTTLKWTYYCNYKNIWFPSKNILREFLELYWEKTYKDKDKDNIYTCNSICIQKIANRFWLINFESMFNTQAKSPRNDYGLIQINGGKWSLWLVKEPLERLDIRWNEQSISLCQNKYKIDIKNDWDNLYKCLLMRHNWRRTLNNEYTLKAFNASKFYKKYLEDKIEIKEEVKK